ncbi:MAG TPA: hypothetical protein VJA40_04780 [archaeon]|nr:hypothetical protein [archaeon]
MVYVSELQKQISKSLYYAAKTPEELRNEFNAPLPEVTKALSGLIKMEIVERKGHPAKYYLTEKVAGALKEKPGDEYEVKGIKLHAVVEAASLKKDELKPQLEALVAQLKENKNFTVHSYSVKDPVEHEEKFHSYLDITFSCKTFREAVFFVYFFGPTLLEVLAPQRLELPLEDFQNGLLDVAQMVHTYVERIVHLSNRAEIAEFNAKLSEAKKDSKKKP